MISRRRQNVLGPRFGTRVGLLAEVIFYNLSRVERSSDVGQIPASFMSRRKEMRIPGSATVSSGTACYEGFTIPSAKAAGGNCNLILGMWKFEIGILRKNSREFSLERTRWIMHKVQLRIPESHRDN